MSTATQPAPAGVWPAEVWPAGAPPGPLGRDGPGGWRRWRGPAALVALVLLGGLVVALLQVRPPVTGVLDPNDTGPFGTHALAALLTGRGQSVTRVSSASAAAAQAGPGTTLVVTSPGLLSGEQLDTLGRDQVDLLLVAPTRAALTALAPDVTLAGVTALRSLAPRCGLAAAKLAGSAEMGGLLLRVTAPGAWRCYPGIPAGKSAASSLFPSFVQYASGGRLITVLGSGAGLSNAELGSDGNAALAMNVLGGTSRVVWLVPGPPAAPLAHGRKSVGSLIPEPVYDVVIQMFIVVLLTALWRARRLGPLVEEPLPAVVRACETVEGHGRLYRSRRARDRAAAALRGAALARIAVRLGLPRGTPADVACQELASRTGRGAEEVRAILFGAVPGDDAALMKLATDLDALEGQVLTQ
jgi:hypothetical protein